MASGRDLYDAERARRLGSQSRRVPADPQRTAPRQARAGQSPAFVLVIARPGPLCRCGEDGWSRPVCTCRPGSCRCGHLEAEHWLTSGGNVTRCTIVTGAGRCGCSGYARAA
jgi:hypothetical protein